MCEYFARRGIPCKVPRPPSIGNPVQNEASISQRQLIAQFVESDFLPDGDFMVGRRVFGLLGSNDELNLGVVP